MALTYAKSGVDIQQENRAISALTKQLTYKRRGFGAPITDVGHYAGLIDFGEYALALTMDGVGSKVLIANEMKRWNTIGIDCIAMNVNDLLAMGIEPLAFVDYIAISEADDEIMRQIGEGLEKGARISRITIVGGETATLPDIVNGFDLAGTCLGMVKKDRVITGERIEPGDAVIGLPSTGVHSNGYSLVRRIIKEAGYSYLNPFPCNTDTTIGDELLTPTRIYIEVLDAVNRFDIHGLAHITGGGLMKLHRITRYGFDITDPLEPQPIFTFLQQEGGVEEHEMYKTFNMGMGFVIVLPEREADQASRMLGGKIVGKIVEEGIRVRGLEIE
ncbi:phosphoribosylformylglycinamidine cyclo-ligase [Candidatus Methanoperedens nitroreducens]|uniref:Phosphoribosylformylglycinamidine cyclo-ligase n=1 Tax=Candidatus Methanoperedens nitratireducens TaxID=1392998 RepID=A0A062V977_9EURY|nr:phosphoribosylformylglycinamidine cyclo-ligase [Candidatus Methanoperedens nitroreducens]KCZ73093.1 phosphoribosylformylglycinamidine cyclo-ligase [Candidatus Methanoperedens nitroreducens]MDJ1422961.1 phosphoribosylformylglycinamidine cyclo-ligase [Candidatus Methanoperedens sp.]